MKNSKLKRTKKASLEKLWKSRERQCGVTKLKTGIKGLDEILDGGIPINRSLLVTGYPGTGKTVFLSEFIYRGISEFDENGVFVTFEERPEDIVKNVKGFKWNLDSLVRQNKLAFVDVSPPAGISREISLNYDLSPLLIRIKNACKRVKAKRIAIDNLSSLFVRFSNKDAVREVIYILFDELKKMGLTSVISGERTENEDFLSRFGIEEYVADGIIELGKEVGQRQIIRKVTVKKLKGAGYRDGKVEFEIANDGIQIFPKLPINRSVIKTEFKTRKGFGIPGLDGALRGGVPEGHMTLVAGNTGTGKTTIAMHFLMEGLRRGENGVWVTLEEPTSQLRETASVYGWDFEKYEKQGKLRIVDQYLIDVSPDKLLHQILDAVSEVGANRVVIDSVSSLESATVDKNKVREFLIQLTTLFKVLGICCLMNYLTRDIFKNGPGHFLAELSTSEIRLSSIVDGVIVLRYVERGQKVEKVLNVLKLRGSEHSKDIFKYEIDKEGLEFGERIEI